MTPAAVLPAHHGQVCPCGAPAVYGLLWRQPPGSRPALRHALACARCAPPEAASWAPPAVALDPLPPSAGPTRPPPADLPSSSGEGEATERSAAPVEVQAEPPAVAVAESEEVGRDLPAQEPLATAGGQPTPTPDPWDGPEGRAHSEPQEAPVARAAATLPPVDPSAPPDRCRLQGCETPRFSRGLCRRHEGQVRRRGQIDLYGLPPVDPREAILRAQAARRKEPAPESAPSTRSTPTRLAQEAHRKEPATEIPAPRSEGTEIREIGLQERDRYAAAEARIASLAAEATQLRARIEELEGLLARKIQQETMRADVAEKRFESLRLDILQSLPPTTLAFDGDNFCVLIRAAIDAERRRVESLRCALEQIAGYAPSPHLPDEVLIRESSEGVAWLRQELEAARGQIAALENSGREGDAAAEELARALGTFALPLLEVARRASAQILEAASRIADLRTALAEVADNDPDERTDAGLIAAATSEVQRLRVDAMLSSRIRELEEDGVRLRFQLLQSQQENSRLETLKTSVLRSIPPTTLAFDGYNLDVLIRAALDAERSRVNDLRGALAEIVDQDLDGQTDADLIAAATSEIQRLREGAVLALTVEELKVRAALLQESEKLRGWLVDDIAVSVRAPGGDWRDIGGDWLFAAVTAVLQARADELERQALEGVSRG